LGSKENAIGREKPASRKMAGSERVICISEL